MTINTSCVTLKQEMEDSCIARKREYTLNRGTWRKR